MPLQAILGLVVMVAAFSGLLLYSLGCRPEDTTHGQDVVVGLTVWVLVVIVGGGLMMWGAGK